MTTQHKTSEYGILRTVSLGYEAAIVRVKELLKEEGSAYSPRST